MYRKLLVGSALLSSLLSANTLFAQPRPYGGGYGDGGRGEVRHSSNQLRDDIHDLRRFQMTLAAFEDAWRRSDIGALRGALRSFVMQGRAEVAEQQRETMQAYREARRSGNEARRDGTYKDYRDAQDDRRDAYEERAALGQERAALAELERAAQAEFAWGPSVPVLVNARQAMQRFIQLAQNEVQRSAREMREDVRERREDNRDYRRGGPPPGYRGNGRW